MPQVQAFVLACCVYYEFIYETLFTCIQFIVSCISTMGLTSTPNADFHMHHWIVFEQLLVTLCAE